MKPKTVFLPLLFCSVLFTAHDGLSQEYRPMNFEQGIWLEEQYEQGGYTEKIRKSCRGDSLVGGLVYYRLFEEKVVFTPPGFLPDTLGEVFLGLICNGPGKTVQYIPGGETEPLTLYDFNLLAGDTVKVLNDSFVIRELDSTAICGRYHKRYSEFEGELPGEGTLTEGVGYSSGLLGYYEYFSGAGETFYRLSCYTERNTAACAACDLPDGTSACSVDFKVFPNPFSDRLTIQAARPFTRIDVFDLPGRKLYSERFAGLTEHTLNLASLPAGTYLLKVQLSSDFYYTIHILKK